MGADANLANTKKGYAAFSAGDIATVMDLISDDIEWITPGNSAISGATHGKQELGAFFSRLAEKGFTTTPQYWFADEERIVVLTQLSIAGEHVDGVDVFTFNAEGKIFKHQSAGDTALLERIFGSK